MKLQSERITVRPLMPDQLQDYMACSPAFEQGLGLLPASRVVPEPVLEAVRDMVLPYLQGLPPDSEEIPFHTLWVVMDNERRCVVGDMILKGRPDADGCVEIGYGAYPEAQGQGYISEAIAMVVEWARLHPSIHYLMAETEEDNYASIRVLKKNNFEQTDQLQRMLWWRLPV